MGVHVKKEEEEEEDEIQTRKREIKRKTQNICCPLYE